jgi:hypothetical protein
MNLNIVLNNYKDRPAEELRGYLQGYVDAYAEIDEQRRMDSALNRLRDTVNDGKKE